jgi:predicted HAD superfamily phosphohydrolase YqeG
MKTREGLTFYKLWRFISLPFSPSKVQTWFAVNSFKDISPVRLVDSGIQGVLLDADGVLGSNGTQDFSESIKNHVQSFLKQGIKVAIYTNAREDRFDQFKNVKVVTNVQAKPNPQGFKNAIHNFLKLEDLKKVCMVGDNYITDGGAIELGIPFIYVSPLKGNEKLYHRATRFYGYLWARLYSKKSFNTLEK